MNRSAGKWGKPKELDMNWLMWEVLDNSRKMSENLIKSSVPVLKSLLAGEECKVGRSQFDVGSCKIGRARATWDVSWICVLLQSPKHDDDWLILAYIVSLEHRLHWGRNSEKRKLTAQEEPEDEPLLNEGVACKGKIHNSAWSMAGNFDDDQSVALNVMMIWAQDCVVKSVRWQIKRCDFIQRVDAAMRVPSPFLLLKLRTSEEEDYCKETPEEESGNFREICY